MLHPYLAGCYLAVSLLAAPSAQAAMEPAPSAPSALRLAAAQCGWGYHLDVSGFCIDSMDRSRICPPRFFAYSSPNGNGYRCVPAEWMRSLGLFNGLL
jgi:hypothetical protein